LDAIDSTLKKISASLRCIPGVRAVVLGGSRANGSADPDSDIDVGVYYDAGGIDLAKLGEAGRLKTTAESYPPRLREAIVHFFSFEAGFSQELAATNAERGDIYSA
jgi:predicted nucleotidyltransferase